MKGKTGIIDNNVYMLKLAYKVCAKRVIVDFIVNGLDVFIWVFTSVIFLKFIADSFEAQKSFSEIARFIIFSAILIGVSTFVKIWYEERFKPMTNGLIYSSMNQMLFDKASEVELECFEDTKFYNSYTLAINEANDRMIFVLDRISKIIFSFIGVIVVYYTMYQIDQYVVWFAIFPLIGNFVILKYLNKSLYKKTLEETPYRRKLSYVDRIMYMQDYANDMRLSKVSNIISMTFNQSVKGIVSIVKKYQVKHSTLNAAQWQVTYTFLYEGVVLYSAYMTLVKQTMTVGEFMILASAMKTGAWLVINLSGYISDIVKNGFYIENLRAFLDYEPSISENQKGLTPEKKVDSLVLKNVSFQYKGQEKNTINNISFSIKRNEKIAIVGHNGSGKSTLVKLLTRLYDPTSGEILLNGTNIKEYNIKEYRALYTTAFQDFQMFSMSIADNVLMGRSDDTNKVTQSLEKSGILGKVQSLDKGIYTTLTNEIDEEGAVLSGGEMQKIAVARAFAKDFEIAIFDEPSSALDPISELGLFNTIYQECVDKTLIFISHRLSTTIHADRIYVLDHGEIVECGTHAELIEQDGKYAEMFLTQAEKYIDQESLLV